MAPRELISLRGTKQGLLISLKEDTPFQDVLYCLEEKIRENPGFYRGAPISFDMGWREIAEADYCSLRNLVECQGLSLLGVISSSLATRSLLESHGIKVIIGRLGLAEHKGRAIRDEAEKEEPPAPAASIAGDENTMLVRRNIRSGQTVNAPGNLLIIGNVNRGAHLEADGDIIVMGALRGTAHAGINGRTSAVIMALNLDPTQLRIADKIALVPAERNPKPNTCFQGAISGDRIVISRYGS